MTTPKFPFELTQEEWSTLYLALYDPNFYDDWRDSPYKTQKIKEFKENKKKIANRLVDEIHEYLKKNTTKDDEGVIHIPIYDPNPKHTRLITYTCRKCGESTTYETDNGHISWQHWKLNHRC